MYILNNLMDKSTSIPKKPYIKEKHWMITTISLDDNYIYLVVIIQWLNFKGTMVKNQQSVNRVFKNQNLIAKT